MKKYICQVISSGIHAVYLIISHQRKYCHRDPETAGCGCEGCYNAFLSNALLDIRVLEDIKIVIKVYKFKIFCLDIDRKYYSC